MEPHRHACRAVTPGRERHVPYEGQTVHYVVTATNGGPATSDKANFSSYVANGYPDKPAITRAVTPRADKTADVTYTIGAAHAGGASGSRTRPPAGPGQLRLCVRVVHPDDRRASVGPQTITVTTCNSASLCQTSGGGVHLAVRHDPGRARPPRVEQDGNSITFSWGTTASNGRPITGYEINGDRNTTVGAGTHSTTFNNLGYSTSRTIRVRAIAQDSGPGPWTPNVTGTTDPKPPPPARRSGLPRTCAPQLLRPPAGCTAANCQLHRLRPEQLPGRHQLLSSAGWSNPDDGTAGTHDRRTGATSPTSSSATPTAG